MAVRRPAEWEQQSGVILAQPSAGDDVYHTDKQVMAGDDLEENYSGCMRSIPPSKRQDEYQIVAMNRCIFVQI